MKKVWLGLEAEGCTPVFANFSAGELSEITGIPQGLQRAWRSRDQLPGSAGKGATFTSRDVAEVLVRYQLSLNGVPPSESAHVGTDAAHIVLLFALLNSDGACEVRGTLEDCTRFLTVFHKDHGIAREIASCSEPFTFLWRGDGGQISFTFEVASYIGKKRFAANFFMDLEVAAHQLMEGAGKPLVTIDLHADSEQHRVKRWTNSRDFLPKHRMLT